MKFALFFSLLVVLPILTLAQSNSTNGTTANNATCSGCNKLYVLTSKNLYSVQNNSQTLCQGNFTYAQGLVVGAGGDILVADTGAKIIYHISNDCANKTVAASNDGNLTSWLSPLDLAWDDQNFFLYVSMSDIDPLWITYTYPRRILARERHVYRLKFDSNLNFAGNFDILSAGIGNGKDISGLKFAENALWGIRKDKYVSQLNSNDTWVDYYGEQNSYMSSDQFVGFKSVDAAFAKCGYMAAVDPLDGQFMLCTNATDVSKCSGRCSNTTWSSTLANALNTGSGISNVDVLPFFGTDSDCINIRENKFSGNVFQPQLTSLQQCDGLLIPSALAIDCDCSLYIGTFGNRALIKYQQQQQNNSNSSVPAPDFASAQVILNFNESISKMHSFNPSTCATAAPTPQPTASNSTAAPTPQPTASNSTAAPTSSPTSSPTAGPASLLARLLKHH